AVDCDRKLSILRNEVVYCYPGSNQAVLVGTRYKSKPRLRTFPSLLAPGRIPATLANQTPGIRMNFMASHSHSLVTFSKSIRSAAALALAGQIMLAAGSAFAGSTGGPEWPQWRGPLGTGAAPDANPPVNWSETSNVKWKTAIPGDGTSTPVIAGNKLFVLTAVPTGKKVEPKPGETPDPGPGAGGPPPPPPGKGQFQQGQRGDFPPPPGGGPGGFGGPGGPPGGGKGKGKR